MGLYINDIRVPGTFPIVTFLKLWGGMENDLSMSAQLVDDIKKSKKPGQRDPENVEDLNNPQNYTNSKNVTMPRDVT